MFVTNWISTTKIQKISEITNFFRHYFLSRTEVQQIILSLDNEQLKDLDKATRRYKISFIYNELEDFTVTTSFRNLDLQEALGRVFGFYPMKATIEDSLIFVECTQKEPTKLMGRVIDERHRPVEFANVALLNPRDSSFLTGGVTNASGNFVLPCGMKKVLAKVSCVGYHTLYNIYYIMWEKSEMLC